MGIARGFAVTGLCAALGLAGGVAGGFAWQIAEARQMTDAASAQAAAFDAFKKETAEAVDMADSGLSRALNGQDKIAALAARVMPAPGSEAAKADLDKAIAELKERVTPRAETVRAYLLKIDPPAAMPDPAKITPDANAAFLASYDSRPDVQRLASGVRLRPVKTGGTGPRPTPESEIVVHYRGTFIEGTEFDSSHKTGAPATFTLSGLIPGWVDGVQKMRPGETWELVLPAPLAYGVAGRGSIPPGQTLIFTIELIEVKSNPAPELPVAQPDSPPPADQAAPVDPVTGLPVPPDPAQPETP
jgi:FKBP-type peptidyl-prolyl cis-trans isomerase